MTNQIDIILNGKGGVGKSFFATNFVQFLKDRQIPHVAIDTDNENSTLKRFHGEAEFINIEDERGIDSIFPALEKAPLVVVDCRAASTDIFLNYFAEVKVFDILHAMDARLTVISPVNHEADSIKQVKIVAEALGSRCQYVVVRNQAHSEHFTIYEKSNHLRLERFLLVRRFESVARCSARFSRPCDFFSMMEQAMSTISIVFALIILLFGFDPPKDEKSENF